MDCWKTQYVTSDGNQSSASRIFISSLQDQPLTSGRVEASASSALVTEFATDSEFCDPSEVKLV